MNETTKEYIVRLRTGGSNQHEAADLIESQSAALENAQARVVELSDIIRYGFSSNALFNYNEFYDRSQKALASTDTAAQTLREKHYEECAVICNETFVNSPNVAPDYRRTSVSHGCVACAAAIRAAAKEQK